MIQINNRKISLPDDVDARYAVYELKFSNKSYIGHTTNRSLLSSVVSLIHNADRRNDYSYNKALNQAIRESFYIEVKLLAKNITDVKQLFDYKYSEILNKTTYLPYGYNEIKKSGQKHKEERAIIEKLLRDNPSLKKHGASKRVCMVNLKTKETAVFNSMQEAALFVHGHASNISACCEGTVPSAYGCAWYIINTED